MAKRRRREDEDLGEGGYEAHKERVRERNAELSRAGRDLGPVPDIANVRRRSRCRASLRLFCETYNPEAFSLGWSEDHLRVLARLEEAATHGALFAFAMPRGSGKTTLCRMAALWAVSYALRRYVFVIGANAAKAEDTLDALKTYVRFLPLYAADFPEISAAAVALGGVANRAAGQLSEGEPTQIEWSKGRIILPTVRPPANWPKTWPRRKDGMVPTAGSIVGVSGLTGDGIRGSLLTLTTGESLRPDLVLLDDPQTDESARSPAQNASREGLVSGAVLGMAGPGKTISAVMPCTVIRPGDLADRILDRKLHPLWRGERTKLLRSMPRNMEAWDGYFDVYRACAQLEPPDFAEALTYYRAHRAELEDGAEASWPARKLDWELSAVQHAMHLYARDPRAFMAEYQNEPVVDQVAQAELQAAAIAEKVNGHARGLAPIGTTRVTAMIDVQQAALFWIAVAWADDFAGAVLDYGCWPEQRRPYYTLAEVNPTLADLYPAGGLEAQLYAGLDALTKHLLGREWARDGGGGLRIERCLVDANWGRSTDTVYQLCRQSPHAAALLPSHGKFVGASSQPLTARKKKPGERMGLHWLIPLPHQKRAVRYVLYDTNFWKSFVAERLAVPMGGRGCLALCGTGPAEHRLLGDHLTSEYRVRVEGRGRVVDEWKLRPERPDNHWWDGLVGAAVAASVQGASLDGLGPASRPPSTEKKAQRSFAEMQRERKRGA